MMLKWPVAVLDVETTALKPGYVVELGVVMVTPYLRKTLHRDWEVRVPAYELFRETLKGSFWKAKAVHGKTMSEMFLPRFLGGEAMPIPEVVEDLDWIRSKYPDAIIGGQNVGFDYNFVKSMYEYVGKKCPWNYHLLDLTALSAVHLGTLSLSDTLKALGIDQTRYTKHSAAGDAEATADALIQLLKAIDARQL